MEPEVREAPRGLRGAVALLASDIVTGGLDYFDYQTRVGRSVLVPWLEHHIDLTDVRVGDFGCHAGGTVEALRDSPVASAIGFELNAEIVDSSPFVPSDRFRLEVADLTTLEQPPQLDLILLHDVLEHVPNPAGVFDGVLRALAPGGHVFVSFPPYWSPYGGHQHLAAGIARAIPYVHYLPERIFYRLAAPADNAYMSSEDSLDDLISVRRTRLSLRKAERVFSQAGLVPVASAFYVLRPEYTVRYGLPTVGAGALGRLPGLREIAVNGAFYLLSRATDAAGKQSVM